MNTSTCLTFLSAQAKKRQYDQEVENMERKQKQTIERLEQDHTSRLRDEAKSIKTDQDKELSKFQNMLKNRKKEVQLCRQDCAREWLQFGDFRSLPVEVGGSEECACDACGILGAFINHMAGVRPRRCSARFLCRLPPLEAPCCAIHYSSALRLLVASRATLLLSSCQNSQENR